MRPRLVQIEVLVSMRPRLVQIEVLVYMKPRLVQAEVLMSTRPYSLVLKFNIDYNRYILTLHLYYKCNCMRHDMSLC
jgi:hypothetical protein